MKLVLCLKDYGTWCRKGKQVEINNNLAESCERRGYVKIIKDLGDYPYSETYIKRHIESFESQIEILRLKIKSYKQKLKELENDNK